MSRKGPKKGKTKDPEQFAVSQPNVADLFDKLSTRSGKAYQRDQHVIKPLKPKKTRPASVGITGDALLSSPLSSPVWTTSTEALDTEEGQEVTKYLAGEILKKQRWASVPVMQETEDYENDLPQPARVAIPPPRQTIISRDRPASVQVDTSQSIYEELDLPLRPLSQSRPVSRTQSVGHTPRYFDKTQEPMHGLTETVKKAPMPSQGSAFVHYSKSVLDTLDRQTPQVHSGIRRTLSEAHIPPMVYGITPEGSSDEKGKPKSRVIPREGSAPMLQEFVQEPTTVSVPTWVTEIPVCTTREPLTQFTQTIQGNSVVTVPAVSLVTDQVRTVDTQKPIDPDFYLPHGLRLSNTTQYKCTESSPEGNPAVIVKLTSLKGKYNTEMFLLDKYSGHLYVPNTNGVYTIIEEKGWIYPTESMLTEPIAGNLSTLGNLTPQSLHLTGMGQSPDAESTREVIRHGPRRPPPQPTVRQQLNEKRGITPTPRTGYKPPPPTVKQLLNEKRGITLPLQTGYHTPSQTPTIRDVLNSNLDTTRYTIETTPVLQRHLDEEHQIHLQMIEEQRQLEGLRKLKIQEELEEEERRRILQQQEIERQRAVEEAQRREQEQLEEQYRLEHEKRMKEIEKERLAELEQRAIQAELERAEREKLEAEQRRAELEAQAREIEAERLREEERIRLEDEERKRQQQEAERNLQELDERRRRIAAIAAHHQGKVQKDLEDSAIDKEINNMREELFGPDGQLDEAKMGFAGRMSRYPSREHLMEGDQECLTARERKYYEDKSRIIAAKISITEGTYSERRTYRQTQEQSHYFKVEYQSILAELQRQQEVCLQKLSLPDVPLPNYPSPISLKTPPSVELEGEELEYYLDKFEEIKRRDQQAAMTHM